jgi:hypothetical protein
VGTKIPLDKGERMRNKQFTAGVIFLWLGFGFVGAGAYFWISGNGSMGSSIITLMSGLFITTMGFVNISGSRR